ncbi:hypothetical protein PF005_g23944 [Phytophthora fragariae]|uniref:Uncharacterized protein n=1 Tax=Phytophthora fragariae TaxID=53985 RepID=A0A6A3W9J0_9STRA|nr:hypothetical protein PF005_g23944 [Phytophthora fragariae]
MRPFSSERTTVDPHTPRSFTRSWTRASHFPRLIESLVSLRWCSIDCALPKSLVYMELLHGGHEKA